MAAAWNVCLPLDWDLDSWQITGSMDFKFGVHVDRQRNCHM
jgi:hypothetical protein